MERCFVKLRSKRGFTLTELLVSILIMSLTVTAIAIAMNYSVSIYTHLKISSEAELLASTLETAISDELHFAKDIVITNGGTKVSWTSKRAGRQTGIITTENGYIKLSSYLDDGTQKESDLIREGAFTSNLTASASVQYDGSAKLFNVSLTISNRIDGYVWKEYTILVKPLNQPS